MRLKDIGELGLIRRITRGLRLDSSVVIGPGDDTAVIKWTKRKHMLYTCDMLVEGTHFTVRTASPFQVGWKAIGRNISDIAAMGGVPRYAVVSAAMPGRTDLRFAEGLYSGIRSLADRFGVSIVGGDVSRSEKIVIDISMIGEVERARLVTRRGAVRGDLICVTGSIGGSSRLKHLNFTPRVKEARRIVRDYKISSMIDVSDGLMLDLWRIADASGVGARIYQNAVPLSPDAGGFDEAVRSGEDFELLFTMGVGEARRFFTGGLARMKTPVTLIGEVTDKRDGLVIVRKDGRPERVKAAGYTHFR